MKIVVNTPTGIIGSLVARFLLLADTEVVILGRSLAGTEALVHRGARLYMGSLEDADFVTAATRGADALLWFTPWSLTEPDLVGFQQRLARAAARAIRRNRIGRVVNISSAGAHLGWGAGPINGLFKVERSLQRACRHITHLRPAYFMENYLWQMDDIRISGNASLPLTGSTWIPMVSARDVALTAARRLLDLNWKGRHILGVHGPRNLTLDEAAQAIGRGLGRKVEHSFIVEEEAARRMEVRGWSGNSISLMLEMYRALDFGHLRPAEERSQETTTPTELEDFAGAVLAPLCRNRLAS